MTLKNQDSPQQINLLNRKENSCTHPASILAPCFCPDTDWWALSVIAVATDMNLKQKKKLTKISHQLYLHVLLRAMKKLLSDTCIIIISALLCKHFVSELPGEWEEIVSAVCWEDLHSDWLQEIPPLMDLANILIHKLAAPGKIKIASFQHEVFWFLSVWIQP